MAPIIVMFFDGWWQVLFVLAGSQPIALLPKGFVKKTILVTGHTKRLYVIDQESLRGYSVGYHASLAQLRRCHSLF